MQHLEVPLMDGTGLDKLMPSLFSARMDGLPKHAIQELSWMDFPYRPRVAFSMAHTGHFMLLKYSVEEDHIRCMNAAINSPVYEDSCVEFFIAFDEAGYYNLEFNCIGTALVGYGKDKANRSLLEESSIQKIWYETKMSNGNEARYKWELMLMIPVQLFTFHSIQSFSGLRCKANFYKCGDLTDKPHYLSWKPIQAPGPDFHLPPFFGKLVFQ